MDVEAASQASTFSVELHCLFHNLSQLVKDWEKLSLDKTMSRNMDRTLDQVGLARYYPKHHGFLLAQLLDFTKASFLAALRELSFMGLLLSGHHIRGRLKC